MRIHVANCLFWLAFVLLVVGCHGTAGTSPSTAPATSPVVANSTATRPVDGNWFPGMLHPPRVKVKLPEDFIISSLDPRGEWNMYDGVIWGPSKTANQYARKQDTHLGNTTEPLFIVRLSSDVGQVEGTNTFTIEKDLDRAFAAMGIHNVNKQKLHWGTYPVLAVSGLRPDGSPFYSAWVGINSPDGWAIFVDYHLPHGSGHPTASESAIWKQFLEGTVAVTLTHANIHDMFRARMLQFARCG